MFNCNELTNTQHSCFLSMSKTLHFVHKYSCSLYNITDLAAEAMEVRNGNTNLSAIIPLLSFCFFVLQIFRPCLCVKRQCVVYPAVYTPSQTDLHLHCLVFMKLKFFNVWLMLYYCHRFCLKGWCQDYVNFPFYVKTVRCGIFLDRDEKL